MHLTYETAPYGTNSNPLHDLRDILHAAPLQQPAQAAGRRLHQSLLKNLSARDLAALFTNINEDAPPAVIPDAAPEPAAAPAVGPRRRLQQRLLKHLTARDFAALFSTVSEDAPPSVESVAAPASAAAAAAPETAEAPAAAGRKLQQSFLSDVSAQDLAALLSDENEDAPPSLFTVAAPGPAESRAGRKLQQSFMEVQAAEDLASVYNLLNKNLPSERIPPVVAPEHKAVPAATPAAVPVPAPAAVHEKAAAHAPKHAAAHMPKHPPVPAPAKTADEPKPSAAAAGKHADSGSVRRLPQGFRDIYTPEQLLHIFGPPEEEKSARAPAAAAAAQPAPAHKHAAGRGGRALRQSGGADKEGASPDEKLVTKALDVALSDAVAEEFRQEFEDALTAAAPGPAGFDDYDDDDGDSRRRRLLQDWNSPNFPRDIFEMAYKLAPSHAEPPTGGLLLRFCLPMLCLLKIKKQCHVGLRQTPLEQSAGLCQSVLVLRNKW